MQCQTKQFFNEVLVPGLNHKQENMCETEILEQELLNASKTLTKKFQIMTC